MLALLLAGEAVFALPFIIARVFRPTLLDVFGITNLQLGTAFSLYGVVAMATYFPGGPLADRFGPRRLLTIALFTTALGGLVYAQIPTLRGLTLLFGFWGVSTILLFWSALLRATRQWGGPDQQGLAYGLLDGGRGVVAAILAAVSVWIFGRLLPGGGDGASLMQRTEALQTVIYLATGLTAFAALITWLWVPEGSGSTAAGSNDIDDRFEWGHVGEVLRTPALWLQAAIVICAYVGYKSTDDFALYARDAFGMNDVEAARTGTIAFMVRPLAALGAGLLGDRIGSSSKVLLWSFVALVLFAGLLGSGLLPASLPIFFLLTVAGASAAICALRGVYYAIFPEANIPLVSTGTAVGLVSVIGYTPDIFMGPLMGWLTDRSPGAAGHEHLFLAVAGFAAGGLVATTLFRRLTAKDV